MPKKILFVCIIVLLVSLLCFPVSAAMSATNHFNKLQGPSDVEGFDSKVTYVNNAWENKTYFQLWTTTRDNRWDEYIGAFYGSSNELNYNEDISARVRPLGNTTANIGTKEGDTISDGTYLPVSRFPSTQWFFTAKFNIVPNDGGTVLDQYLTGYLYLFYVNSNGVVVKKSGYPINYTQGYLANNESVFSADVMVGNPSALSSDIVGVVPVFTFYNLSLFNLTSVLVFPAYEYGYYVTNQQEITNNQDVIIGQNDQIINNQNTIINSKPPASNSPIKGDFDDMQNAENDIFDSVSSGFDVIDSLRVTALELVTEFGPVMYVCSAVFNLFADLPFINVLLILSLTFGVFGIIANIAMDALTTYERSKRNKRTSDSRSKRRSGSDKAGGRSKKGDK